MALKIIRESDPIVVTQLKSCFYSVPGIGKSSLGFSIPNAAHIDFDKGAHRAKNRRDTISVDCWDDAAEIDRNFLAPFDAVNVDTAGRALDFLTSNLIENDPKLRNKNGGLTQNGFGALKSTFNSWMSRLCMFGKDVTLFCHSDEQKRGDEVTERLDVQGSSRNEIYKVCDLMGRLYIENGKRWLNCNPGDVGFGKNPTQLPILEVPDFAEEPNFLGNLLQRVKRELNAQTESQRLAAAHLEAWRAKVLNALTAEDFNTLKGELADDSCSEESQTIIKRLMVDTAKGRGIEFNVKKKEFVKEAA